MRGAFDDGTVCGVATDARVRRAETGMAADTAARRAQRERAGVFIVRLDVGACVKEQRRGRRQTGDYMYLGTSDDIRAG